VAAPVRSRHYIVPAVAIAALLVGHYQIPLPVVLSDSHGNITHFELVTVPLTARDGAEATANVNGAGGAAIRAPIARGLASATERFLNHVFNTV
jgi:hypothetical protein